MRNTSAGGNGSGGEIDSFTLAWLFLWVRRVNSALGGEIEEYLAERGATGGTVSLRSLSDAVYPLVRYAAYLAWAGQVGFLRAEARRYGASFPYVPGMGGVSPVLVDDALRAALRLYGNVPNQSRERLVKSLMHRLGSLVESCASRAAVGMVEDDVSVRMGAYRKARAHGQPLRRFFTASDSGMGQIGDTARRHPVFTDLRHEIETEYAAVFGDTDTYGVDISDVPVEYDFSDRSALEEAEEVLARLTGEKLPGKGALIGYARIPQGIFTCSFCLLLCSRGAVYKKSATELSAKTIKKRGGVKAMKSVTGRYPYHWGCDCKSVPVYRGNKYTGQEIVRGAETVYSDFSRYAKKHGVKLTAAQFAKWIEKKGRAAALKHVPGLMEVSSAKYREIQRKIS